MKNNLNRNTFTSFILSITVCLFSFCSSGSSCEYRDYGFEPAMVPLIKCMKDNGYCPKYTSLMKVTDQYGHEKWEPTGYFTISREQYDEMIKYADGYAYTNAATSFPQYTSLK